MSGLEEEIVPGRWGSLLFAMLVTEVSVPAAELSLAADGERQAAIDKDERWK